jgi:DNA repair protein RAD5
MCDKGPYKMSDLRSVQRRRKRINPITGAFTDDDGHPVSASQGETAVTIGKVDLVSSTKLRALVRKLDQMRIEEPEVKALVFSQFTSFLGERVRSMSGTGVVVLM